MRSRRVRCLAAVAGTSALIAMGGLTAACGGKGEEKPSTTTTTTTTTATTTTTTTPPVSSTENNINPGGPNLFTPTPVQPAPTVSTHKRQANQNG
jgi:hypothetical protein